MTGLVFQTLSEAANWYREWLTEAALPLWATTGVDARTGAFVDALTLAGEPVLTPHRARVQARQAFVYASATRAGLGDKWLPIAERGYAFYRQFYRRPDGLFAVLTADDGRVLDDTPYLYEQAFSLFAMAELQAATSAPLEREATATRLALEPRRHPAGGFVELGAHPYQANATMHLLEAALAWEAAGGEGAWSELAEELIALARGRFIDAKGGFLREFFDADWRPAAGDEGRWVEPGHQFEWSWLLAGWAARRGDAGAAAVARILYERGLQGVDRKRGVAMNVLWDDLEVRDPGARLWPQTEYLKAALRMGDEAEALNAAAGLAKYLDVPLRGAWRDKMRADGGFLDEPAPASSFYHIMIAVLELLAAAGQTGRA
jgi:mannose-6-phosphate isomerase